MRHFLIDRKYADLLKHVGLSPEEVLKKSMLPQDLFSRKIPSVTDIQYFRFIEAIDELTCDDSIAIKLATSENIETFSPPVFAAYCSKNAVMCIKRLAQYKALIGTVVFLVEESHKTISVEIKPEDENLELPELLVLMEMVFLVNLIRSATKACIIPNKITVINKAESHVYEEFFKTSLDIGEKNCIKFSRSDLEIPFITRNDAMWEYFEPELKRRLSEMEVEDTFSARVRSALIELLPSGESSIECVAQKLGCSKRTLQRKLKEENTTFQKQLNHTRELLAKNYIKNTDMTIDEIAYLIGYQDSNSFSRAFTLWTGMNISDYKKIQRKNHI